MENAVNDQRIDKPEIKPCPFCLGTGFRDGEECNECDGIGEIENKHGEMGERE